MLTYFKVKFLLINSEARTSDRQYHQYPIVLTGIIKSYNRRVIFCGI
jgi:hypothetical protein